MKRTELTCTHPTCKKTAMALEVPGHYNTAVLVPAGWLVRVQENHDGYDHPDYFCSIACVRKTNRNARDRRRRYAKKPHSPSMRLGNTDLLVAKYTKSIASMIEDSTRNFDLVR